MLPLRHILVPLDFSTYAEEALPYATTLACKYQAKVTLLHVLPLPLYIYMGSYKDDGMNAWHLAEHILETLEEEVKQKLATVFSPAERVELEIVEKVTRGLPFDEIIQEAKKEQVDLIVMTTHGRTGAFHLLLGSVAEQVVREAPCPVLTIRKPPTEKERGDQEKETVT